MSYIQTMILMLLCAYPAQSKTLAPGTETALKAELFSDIQTIAQDSVNGLATPADPNNLLVRVRMNAAASWSPPGPGHAPRTATREPGEDFLLRFAVRYDDNLRALKLRQIPRSDAPVHSVPLADSALMMLTFMAAMVLLIAQNKRMHPIRRDTRKTRLPQQIVMPRTRIG